MACSQRSFLPVLLSVGLMVTLSSPCHSQSLATPPNAEKLIATLLQAADQNESALPSLLQENAAAVTLQLWQVLMNKAAVAYRFQGVEQTFKLYRIALAVTVYLKDEKLIAYTHYQTGMTYSLFGKSPEAIHSLFVSQQHFTAAGRKRDLIYVLSDLGALYLYQNDYPQAQRYSEQAIALAEAVRGSDIPAGYLPDEYGLASAYSTLGALCKREGKYAQAITHLQRAIGLYQGMNFGKQKYAYQLADNLTELGRVQRALGDNAQALLLFQQALEITDKSQLVLAGNILNSIGLLYLEQENYAQAESYFDRSLAAYESSRNPSDAALVLLNLGVTYQRQERYEIAVERFTKALTQAGEVDKDVVIAVKQGLGAVYRAQGKHQSSMGVLNEGLTLAEKLGDQTRVAEILWRKAETQYDLRNFDEAVALANQARGIARQLQLPKLSYLTTTLLGKVYLAQRRHDLASTALAEAIDQVESMRSTATGQEQGRQLFFEKKVAPYHLLIGLLIDQGKLAEALQYAERAKARVLLDVMSNGRWRPTKEMSASEAAEVKQLNDQMARLNDEFRKEQLQSAPDAIRLQQTKARLETARLKYAAFQDWLHAKYAGSKAEQVSRAPLNQSDLDRLLPRQQTALLTYVVTSEQTFLFLLTRKAKQQPATLHVYPIAIMEEALRVKVIQYRNLLANRHGNYATLAGELYQLLIQPVAAQLQGISTIGIVADGVLWELPFQALQSSNDHFLIDDFAIFYAPSLQVMKELKARKATASTTGLLAFANPVSTSAQPSTPTPTRMAETAAALPEAETEVRSLKQIPGIPPSQVFIGNEADEKTFKSLAPTYRNIHCATHGTLDNHQPLYSHLLFSPSGSEEDGLLEAREVLDLKLNADLVVLSACETARGKIGAGEGMIGLSWAFLAAGSRSTVVSQWKISSASTTEWMKHFYQRLYSSNSASVTTKAEAMRAAMLTMRKADRYAHPFYWAGFILLGNND